MKQNAEAEAPAEEKKETVQAPETAATEEKAEKKKAETPEEKIAKLEKAILELQDTRLRLIAEMDNLRKRSAKDLETTRYNVMTDTLHPFFRSLTIFPWQLRRLKHPVICRCCWKA